MKRGSRKQGTLDGFVVRSPKVSPASSPTKQSGGMRQATLESLKGVVVVEEMERARVVLERTDVSTELKVDTLQHLLCKTPAKEVLIRTKLGKTVHKLCRAEQAEVAAIAQQVYTSWKNHILSKVNRPYIEVKCDLKTQKLRNSARQMLLEALQRETEEGGKSSREVEVLERKEIKVNVLKNKQKDKDEGNNLGKLTHKRRRDDSDIEKHVQEEEEEGKNRDHKRLKEDSCTEKYKQKSKVEGRSGKERNDMEKYKHKNERSEDTDNEKGFKEHSHLVKYEQENKEAKEGRGREERTDTQQTHDSVDTLAEHIEMEVYLCCKRRVDNCYRRTIRTMVFTLRHQRDIRKAVVLATLSVGDFIKQHRKS